MEEIDLSQDEYKKAQLDKDETINGAHSSSENSDQVTVVESRNLDLSVSEEIKDDSCPRQDLRRSEAKTLPEHGSNLVESSSVENVNCFSFEQLLEKSKEELISILKESFHKRLTVEQENERCRNEENFQQSTLQKKVEALEKELAQAKADAFAWENELQSTRGKLTEENVVIRSELTSRLEALTKQYRASNKDKESMVVKYAMAEKEVLIIKKQKENLERKLRDLEKDKEILQGKIKTLTTERSRICSALDNKIQENGLATRNIEKLKEEINAKDIKIKWGHTKLKTEIEAHKDTQSKLDRALAKICNHEEEIQSTREEAERIVRETKEGENTRANLLDKQLQETKALLILEKQKYEDINDLYKLLKTEHESLRSSHILLDTEVTTLRVKVSKFEQEREESEKLFESLQGELKTVKQGAADLSQRLSNSAVYAEQLESEKVKAGFAEQQIKDLQMRLEEQSVELSKCREKEAELLGFTQKLTDKDVTLRSQLTASHGKVRLLEIEHGEMKSQVQALQKEVSKLTKELFHLKESKAAEESRLSSLLQEKTQEASNLRTKVSDLLNEIQVQQKKHSNSLKDSNREIQKLRKKLDNLESNMALKQSSNECVEGGVRNGDLPPSWNHQESLSQESRTSSNASLNTVDSSYTNGSSSHPSLKDPTAVVTTTGTFSPIHDLPQQVLIDRIVKLQKTIIKKSEKLEFLEEHVEQLLSELKKKNKIIHHYIMKEDAGALINSKSDYAKAEIIKHGGIMASVYGSSPKDGTMTLDLSLEINKKLQAVLEDTLLKNITLKENLNTLGDEVAKLALENSSNCSRSS